MWVQALKRAVVGMPFHNQTALFIKGVLLFRKGLVVINVPDHLSG